MKRILEIRKKLLSYLHENGLSWTNVNVFKGNNTQRSPLEVEIEKNLKDSVKKVIIYAPMFSADNEKDGYIQRIKRIDETIFHDFLRIYVYENEERSDCLKPQKVDNSLYYVQYNPSSSNQRKTIIKWTKLAGLQYFHSVYRLMHLIVHKDMTNLISKKIVKTIWDVHGAVPEEILELHGNQVVSKKAGDTEKILMENADVIITVNHAMQQHLTEKYGRTNALFITLPIININFDVSRDNIKKNTASSNIPVIVYCGGLQKWQNINLMQNIIEKTSSRYQYQIIVPDPDTFCAYWSDELPANLTITSKSSDELEEVYKLCHYGFAIRDDTVINRVACPTKILEYVNYGIIPIFKSPHIGDFEEMGIHYIDYQDILAGNILSEETRVKYAYENYKILEEMWKNFLSNTERLRKIAV